MTPALTRPAIPYPDPDDVDAAPQLLVVALADAALRALDRSLDSAHPVLGADKRPGSNPPPLLLTTERLAIELLDAVAQLGALLHDYADSVRLDLADLHDDDQLDPF